MEFTRLFSDEHGDTRFEDVIGKGHRLRHIGPEEINIMLLPVPDGSPVSHRPAETVEAAAGRSGSGQ